MWNFEINNNGNTAEDIGGRFVDVVSVCHMLEDAISSLHQVVHGRNYQTLEKSQELREKDLQIYWDMMESTREIRDIAIKGVVKSMKSMLEK